jgi:diguanylate cyclase (GGDEF)-like protein/PAS domain S-box-containing protein
VSSPAVSVGVDRAAGESASRARTWIKANVWIGYLVVSGILAVLYLFASRLAGNGPLINVLGLSSPVAILVGIRLHRPKAMGAWWLFAAGQFLFFAGDLYTYSYPKLLGADVPFPSAGDAIYLMVYPALMAGLFLLVKRRNPKRDRAGLIDSLILTIGVGLFSWVFLIAPNVHLSGLSVLATGVSIAYPLGDILLLAAAIRLAVDTGKRAPAFYLLIASIVCLFVTDSVYGYALLKGTYDHQLSLDAGWIAYYVLWGAAALHPSMRTLEQPSTEVRSRLTSSRLALLAAACLIAPGIRFVQDYGNADVIVLMVASAALFLLVVARMAGLVRQEEHATSRELALRNAGGQLVAAAGHEQIYEAAISAVQRLLGLEATVRLALASSAGQMVVAGTEGGEDRLVSGETQVWLDATTTKLEIPFSDIPSWARNELRVPDGDMLVMLPLSTRDGARGHLVICSPNSAPPELLDSLESLAAQISLALEAASLTEDLHRRQSEARFRSLVAHSSDLITVLDSDGIVTYQSPSIARVLGYEAEEIEGTQFDLLLHEADRPGLSQVITGAGRDGMEAHVIECSLRHRDGNWLQFEVQHADLLADEHVRGIVLNSRDVSERKAFEEQLAHQAFHDPVTKLANRPLFSDRVQHALTRAQRSGATVAVMFIDLDEFKTVNDSLGHPAGDRVLREVASRLSATVRPTDTVARFGGDEFAVLLDGVTDLPDAADAAARLLRAVEAEFDIDGKQVFPRASVGICLVEPGGPATNAEELLRNADVAMYMAKRDCKGSYRVFEPAMHERVLERLELRSDLQQAIAMNQLAVHYQPIVRLQQGEIYGVEALLRWSHPTRGNITPDQFIPIAEESGLIIPIGRWVLQVACNDGAVMHAKFPRPTQLTISVNLSVRQLQSETIVADVRDALATSGLPPSALILEITESVMLADTELAVRRLQDLKELGVRLAMDDFGTGYSSLSYLGRFPVEILKMDRSFLASRDNDALAAAIIALGENLQLDVVAEGIEHSDQASWLTDQGCVLGQGFHFARPMGDLALFDYLQERNAAASPPIVVEPQVNAA